LPKGLLANAESAIIFGIGVSNAFVWRGFGIWGVELRVGWAEVHGLPVLYMSTVQVQRSFFIIRTPTNHDTIGYANLAKSRPGIIYHK